MLSNVVAYYIDVVACALNRPLEFCLGIGLIIVANHKSQNENRRKLRAPDVSSEPPRRAAWNP